MARLMKWYRACFTRKSRGFDSLTGYSRLNEEAGGIPETKWFGVKWHVSLVTSLVATNLKMGKIGSIEEMRV